MLAFFFLHVINERIDKKFIYIKRFTFYYMYLQISKNRKKNKNIIYIFKESELSIPRVTRQLTFIFLF